MLCNKSALFLGLALLPSLVFAQAPVVDIGDSARASRQQPNQQNVQGELYLQIQQLRQEMMELRGTIEEQGHQIRQLKQQGLDRYIDLDRRISVATGGEGSATGLPTDTGFGGGAEVIDGADPDGSDVVAGAAVPVTAGGLGQGATSVATAATSSNIGSGDPSRDYQVAYGLVRERKFEDAITAFNVYVQQYPEGRYTPNAWYWLGELHLAVQPQNLVAAKTAFQKLLGDYPDNGKVPAAMYKLATVYFLDGEKQKAKDMLTHVIDRYSNTGNSAVQKSREFLRKNF
jgi:tol-pal system protein YbgF